MNNKILKSLVLLSIITIIFFIKIDNVKADAQASGCSYYVPMTFISSDGKAALFKLSIADKSKDTGFWHDLFNGTMFGGAGNSSVRGTATNTYDITGLCVKNNILYIATNLYGTADGENKITDQLWEYSKISTPFVPTSRYYKADAKSGAFTPATEADYKRYLVFLSGKLKGGANRLFVSKNIGKVEYVCISDDACVIGDKNHVIINEVIGDYIVFAYGGDIISPDKSTQKLTSTLEPYPNEEWGYFDLMCSEANKDGNYDCDKAKQGLEKVIDTGDVDRRTFTKAYYTATKDPWANFMKTTNDKAMQEKTGTFRYWFDNVGRYAYEDRNSAPFKIYWNYICDNKAYSVTEEECESVNGFLEGKTDFKNYTNYKKDLENDPCMAAFAPNCLKGSSTVQYNGTACDAQKKAGAYKTCKNCVDKSKTKGDTTTQEAFKEQCMGADNYAKFKEAYSNQIAEYDEQIKNAAKNGINSALSLYNLRVANAPTLNVTFGGKYQVDCDDFKVLKIIYDIMVIIAPVMLIVFGSIDYAKAVMASDVEKIRKAQKKFIPRVIAAVLLFIIPVAIRLILSFAGLEDTALTCIIK